MCHPITNRKWLNFYLDADKFALGKKNRRFPYRLSDSIWRFEFFLRHYEYCKNTSNKLGCLFWGVLLHVSGVTLGFSISANCFGPGLRINHSGLLVVNSNVKIGKWCDIHQGVNIGENSYYNKNTCCVVREFPTIGDYVYIAPGVKIFGDCTIGKNVRLGANCVINKSVPDDMTCFGIPFVAKKSHKNLLTIANEDTELDFLRLYPQYKGLMAQL